MARNPASGWASFQPQGLLSSWKTWQAALIATMIDLLILGLMVAGCQNHEDRRFFGAWQMHVANVTSPDRSLGLPEMAASTRLSLNAGGRYTFTLAEDVTSGEWTSKGDTVIHLFE